MMDFKLSNSAVRTGLVPVQVDPSKIERDWETIPNRARRVEDFINGVVSKGSDKLEYPEGYWSGIYNKLVITNGKHRVDVLISRGEPVFVAVPVSQRDMIESRIGNSESEPNLTAWAMGDWPNPDGEVKADGPGIMPTKPAEATSKGKPDKFSNKQCGDSWIPDHEICHEPVAEKPERVVAAAIKVNGKIYTGPMHALALMFAAEDGAFKGKTDKTDFESIHEAKDLIDADGFVTSKGRFISREEAFNLAHKSGQVQQSQGHHGAGRLGSEDLENAVKREWEMLNNSGKPCGDSWIPDWEDCHQGHGEFPKKQEPKKHKSASLSDIIGKTEFYQPSLSGEKHGWGGSSQDYKPQKPWKSSGAVVFRDDGKISIRKVAGNYSGTAYSFGKGRVDDGETDEQAAHREVLEEMGHHGEIVGDLGHHKGQMSTTHFYLMKHSHDEPEKMDKETDAVHWVDPSEAADKLDSVRDLRVLVKAMHEMKNHVKP